MLSFYPANTPTVFPHSQDPLPGPFSLGAHKAASCSLFRLQISVPCWGGLPDHPPTPTHKECRCLIWLFSWHTAPEKLCYLFVDLLIAYLPSLKYALSCSELHYQHLEIWSLNKYWMNITEYTCFLTTKRNDNTSLAVLLRELNEKMNIKCWPQCLKHSKSLMFGFFFFFTDFEGHSLPPEIAFFYPDNSKSFSLFQMLIPSTSVSFPDPRFLLLTKVLWCFSY